MKKILILVLLLSSELNFAQCDDDILIQTLRGVWVKNTGHPDTIKFSMLLGSAHNFELIIANMRRPQYGPAGIYEFRALGTTMLVRWLPGASSGAETISFYFDRSLKEITIGNFYHADQEGKTLVFRKIK